MAKKGVDNFTKQVTKELIKELRLILTRRFL